MRDPKRLDKFYDEVKRIHKKHFPDWRFGQFMYNFLGWVSVDQGRDPFFPEEDEMIKYLRDYAGEEE